MPKIIPSKARSSKYYYISDSVLYPLHQATLASTRSLSFTQEAGNALVTRQGLPVSVDGSDHLLSGSSHTYLLFGNEADRSGASRQRDRRFRAACVGWPI
ncbi:hypothetical protein EVAR_95953_1 [Eumeta japonica]|uniref:Uncharacterized protein n=1 Tax=Eumeta variegata TaxID=151549 RepID=A0A4C1V825_EUMVA|nr:hypothetical protein EVAR_95953_1 [Eumeta japonica]